jgi:hypothetical protein
MKVLVISGIGTLGQMHDQALKNKNIQCVNHNALLYSADSKEAWIHIPDSPMQMCFGYYYSDLPPEDSRFAGKEDWFDVLVEISTKKMEFLARGKRYVHLETCHSVSTIVKAIKDDDIEEGRSGSGSEIREGDSGQQL